MPNKIIYIAGTFGIFFLVFAFVAVVVVLIENAIFLFPFHYCLFRWVQKQKNECDGERKYKVKSKQRKKHTLKTNACWF